MSNANKSKIPYSAMVREICFITGTWYMTIPIITIISISIISISILSFYYFLLILYIFCVAAHVGEINFV